MHVFEGERAQDIYIKQLRALVEQPFVEVRGHKTQELLNVATVIHRPQDMCILIPSRRWNPWVALSESLWMLAGRQDVATLARFNKRIVDFSDDGETMYGAYGYRIQAQLPYLIDRLQKDPNDRRAVLSIWRPEDLWAATKDPPCNDMVMFKLRDGKLHMTVINRSNDIHWGLYAVNIPQFAMLQCWIALSLGVQLGTQTHFSNSLHTYLDDAHLEITDRMLSDPNMLSYPKHLTPAISPVTADMALRGVNSGGTFAAFAISMFESYTGDLRLDDYASFMDWSMAAGLWKEMQNERRRSKAHS